MRLIVVALVSLVLAFSLNAQPLTLDPEMVNISEMSEDSVFAMRTQPLTFTPAPRRSTVSPAGTDGVKAVIWIDMGGPLSPSRTFWATFLILTPLPEGSTMVAYMTSPSGVKEVVPGLSYTVPAEMAGNIWAGQLWFGSFPPEWVKGICRFEVEIVVGGVKTTVIAQVGVRMNPLPLFGPLESAEPTPDGGILLTGVFPTHPIVVAPQVLSTALPVEGGRFIPSSVGLSWETLLVVCSGTSPRVLECSTRRVYIPSRDSSPRER